MMGETGPFIIGQAIGGVIGLALGTLVGALIAQIATRIIAKFKPPYGMAYKAAFLAGLASLALGIITTVLYPPVNDVFDGVFFGLLVSGFFIQSFVYGKLIRDTGGVPLGFGRGVLVSLTQWAIAAGVVVLVGGLIYLWLAVS